MEELKLVLCKFHGENCETVKLHRGLEVRVKVWDDIQL